MPNRFDHLLNKTDEYLRNNGLVAQSPEEHSYEQMAFNSAVPLSTIWEDKNNDKKIVAWDDQWEAYLKKRTDLINLNRRAYFPWNIYQEMGLRWINGLTLNQSNLGSCAGAAHRNTQGYSDLVNCKMAEKKPTEIGVDIVYALARGRNGNLNWGSGANGTGLVKWSTEIGNYWASDIGPYDVRGRNVTAANMNNPAFKARALQKQSIVVFVPRVDFNLFYKACEAGLSIWFGSTRFPSAATKKDNVSRPSRWTSGNHAMGFGFGMEVGGRRLLWWSNQHGNRYSGGAGDQFNTPGDTTWVDENEFKDFRINHNFGNSYVHIGECPRF